MQSHPRLSPYGIKQGEVQDENNTGWTCVQAFAGVDGDSAAAAEAKAKADSGPVAVVCTSGGGAGTVRLELSRKWDTEMSDEALVAAIRDAAR